jgi:NAD(P)-dependent dehydrogenase (short-subunit alcohol dehydrogenase family)
MANIIITGAGQGIGYYFTEQALKDGNHVAVLDIEVDQLKDLEAAYPGQLLVFQVDVCREEQIKSAVTAVISEFHTLDIVIHNACLCTFDQEADTDLLVYRKVFDVNYYGALRFVKCVIPYLQAQKKGKVMFTSSGVGVTGFIGISPYASTKGALEALAKCLNVEYAGDGVSFHILHPPLTRTKSSEPLPVPKEFMADPKKVGYGLAKHINAKHFIICHSFGQKVQTLFCYLYPIKMGKLLSKMTMKFVAMEK